MDKAVQHLYKHCILDMQQYRVEPINVGLYCTLPLGIFGPFIPFLVGSINGHELLLEEEFQLLPS